MVSQGTFRLRANGPYDFDLSYSFYRRSRFELIDRYADRCFSRPILHEGNPVMITIPCGQGQMHKSLTVRWQSLSPIEDISGLRSFLRKMLYLDFDLNAFYRSARDRVMKRLITAYPGFRPIMTPTIFESAAWAIMGQQMNLNFAYRLKSRLVQHINRSFSLNGEKHYLFPTPADIASLTYSRLRSFQFSARKAEYLIDFSRLVADKVLHLEELADLDYATALHTLLEVRGIGVWSANYILMRGAYHHDAFPVGDSGLNSAITKLYHLDQKPGPDVVEKLGEKWRPYRSLAAFYLWKSLTGGV